MAFSCAIADTDRSTVAEQIRAIARRFFVILIFIFQPQMKMIAHQAKQGVAAVRRDF
jgi:hypothetical protein